MSERPNLLASAVDKWKKPLSPVTYPSSTFAMSPILLTSFLFIKRASIASALFGASIRGSVSPALNVFPFLLLVIEKSSRPCTG